MNAGFEQVAAACRSDLDRCGQVANIVLDGSERIQQIGYRMLRDRMACNLSFATSLSRREGLPSLQGVMKVEDMLAYFRQIAEALHEMNAALASVFADQCAAHLRHAADFGAGAATRPVEQLEPMLRMWTAASRQMGEFAASAASARLQEGSDERLARRRTKVAS